MVLIFYITMTPHHLTQNLMASLLLALKILQRLPTL